MATDPFPRGDFTALLKRLPAYARLAWRLARDPSVSRVRRAALIGAAAYLVSPIDLVPGIIPVVGQLDDVALILGALRLALGGLDADARGAHLRGAGLSDADLSADAATLTATSRWLVRTGGRTASRLLGIGAGLARSGLRASRTRGEP